MKLLVLGGSIFVGRNIVIEAAQRGHHITVFTRGRHLGNLPLGINSIVGDRRQDISVLAKQHWDAVVDTSGYRPDEVRRSAAALRNVASYYAFISTLDVYPNHSAPGLDESAPVMASWDSGLEPTTEDGYRLLKAACEQEVREFFPTAHQIFRSGLVVGAGDPTGRFSYWPLRVDRGGEVLAPAPQSSPLQFIDVRDHAAFVLDLIESGACGIFNTTSPPGAHTFDSLLTACVALAKLPTTLTWIDEYLLAEHSVRPWTELPLWPGSGQARAGTMMVSTTKAQAVGLTCRSVYETVSDVLGWARNLDELPTHRGQLSPNRERLLLLIAHEEGYVTN